MKLEVRHLPSRCHPALAGHRSFATTNRYIDLVGVVFPDEAEELAERMLGVQTGTRLTAPQSTSEEVSEPETRTAA